MHGLFAVGQRESDASPTVCATAAALLSLFDPDAEDKSFMQEPDLFFVTPTYRLREVGETVEQYDEQDFIYEFFIYSLQTFYKPFIQSLYARI
jgi:hypothetical protein